MLNTKITFFDNIPHFQREILKNELSSLQIEYDETDRPLSNDFIIPTLIVVISFLAKPFFEAFLSEFGKDTYGWIKIKFGLAKANSSSPIKVSYQIVIGEGRYFDYDALLFSEHRHGEIIKAVEQVVNKCPVDLLQYVRLGILKYDSDQQKYISASLYSSTSIHGEQTDGKLGIEPLNIMID
jgi:hypothetical protein